MKTILNQLDEKERNSLDQLSEEIIHKIAKNYLEDLDPISYIVTKISIKPKSEEYKYGLYRMNFKTINFTNCSFVKNVFFLSIFIYRDFINHLIFLFLFH